MAKPKLVIIPGIGDRSRAYEVFAAVWRLWGFEVHIIPFGWSNYYADYETKMRECMHQLDRLGKDEPAYIIGVSAGGVAAVNVFADRPSVKRVITVCSPYREFDHELDNRLLAEAITELGHSLDRLDPSEKRNILSVHAVYDQVVGAAMSRPPGIKSARFWGVTHGPTIFLIMTSGVWRLRRFLRTGK